MHKGGWEATLWNGFFISCCCLRFTVRIVFLFLGWDIEFSFWPSLRLERSNEAVEYDWLKFSKQRRLTAGVVLVAQALVRKVGGAPADGVRRRGEGCWSCRLCWSWSSSSWCCCCGVVIAAVAWRRKFWVVWPWRVGWWCWWHESQLVVVDDDEEDEAEADTDIVVVEEVVDVVLFGHRWQHQISQLLSVQLDVNGAHGIGVEGRSGQQSSDATESFESEPLTWSMEG